MRAHEFIQEHRLVWKRNPKTGAVSMKWRCESGPRAGRTVPTIGDCSKPLDIAKAQQMKKTRSVAKSRTAKRAGKTKRVNPASRLTQRLNRALSTYRKKPKK